MINLSQVSLLDLLPHNLKMDKSVSAAAQAIDAELAITTAEINKLSIYTRLDSLTSEEADALAWQYHVDFYDPSLPLERKRALVINSFAWHRRKGTPSAVEELVATIFGDGEVLEWYQFGGEPGTFRVATSNNEVTDEQAQRLIDAIGTVKNTRSHLNGIQITATDDLNLYFGYVVHVGEYLTFEQVT
ncbi:phage tail protein I [Paenibacillus sp. NRS-1760]|uniref:phage tail protein I n=1 Tax=Paenibacillus sp. NRS-1760 TaxID=3233902 RepID=UPI003D2A2808